MKRCFQGWYFKIESKKETIAVIPAVLCDADGARRCLIQLVTERGSTCVWYPFSAFHCAEDTFDIRIGRNRFTPQGIRLDIRTKRHRISGLFRFGPWTPPRYDMMGPFRFLPFMECRHSVYSLRHRACGYLNVDGTHLEFTGAVGYIEGDGGHSFPREYLWTQCHFGENALMLAVADIPLFGFHFTGVLGSVLFAGREYRIATYLGARAVKLGGGRIVVRQGKYTLTASLPRRPEKPLYAPESGAMRRFIREDLAGRAAYRFSAGGKTLFKFRTGRASFEYEYGR